MKTEVYCYLQIEGLHRWADCPIEEVAYLRDPHRHMFGVKAYMPVTHSDRDVEFIELKHKISQWFWARYWDPVLRLHNFDKHSCEHLGAELIEHFGLSKVEINEDSENGMIMYNEEI